MGKEYSHSILSFCSIFHNGVVMFEKCDELEEIQSKIGFPIFRVLVTAGIYNLLNKPKNKQSNGWKGRYDSSLPSES